MIGRASLILVLVAVIGCARKPGPVIVLDGWWDADFAKGICHSANSWYNQSGTARMIAQFGCDAVTSCAEMMPVVNACVLGDPTQEVREFEGELATVFATDPVCHNLTLVRMTNPKNADAQVAEAVSKPHWFLTLDFSPGSAEQSWRLLSPNHQLHTGTGDPRSIASSICAVASKRGGSLGN